MNAEHFQVPTVDISSWVAPDGSSAHRATAARALDEACRGVGFVQILGHGVPEAVIDGLTGAMDAFFGQPLEAKKAYRTPPEINRGYTAPKSESLSLSLGVESASRMNDFFEAFNVGCALSDYPDVPGLPARRLRRERLAAGRPRLRRGSLPSGTSRRTSTRPGGWPAC